MRSFVIGVALVASACVVEDELELSETEEAIESTNRISLNRISLNRISLNRISLNSLQQAASVSDSLVNTLEGREILSYVIGCALPETQTLTLKDQYGVPYAFPGSLGLAPGWATGVPSATDKRWVSACLMARTNHYGVSVRISLRGNHDSLAPTGAETSAFPYAEGAFWGDVFSSTTGTMNACSAALKVATTSTSTKTSSKTMTLKMTSVTTPETDTTSQFPTYLLRDCAISDDGVTTRCGFAYHGACATACSDGGQYYNRCDSAHTNQQTVTVYLEKAI